MVEIMCVRPAEEWLDDDENFVNVWTDSILLVLESMLHEQGEVMTRIL
jgi:hypothetical protein